MRILKWFAIPFSSRPHFIRTLHHDPSIMGGLHGMAHGFIELDKAVATVHGVAKSRMWLSLHASLIFASSFLCLLPTSGLTSWPFACDWFLTHSPILSHFFTLVECRIKSKCLNEAIYELASFQAFNYCSSYPCCCSVAQLYLTLHDSMDCASQASLSFTVSQSLLKLTSIELVMPSNHLMFCYPLFLLPSIFPSIRVFANELALRQTIGVAKVVR